MSDELLNLQNENAKLLKMNEELEKENYELKGIVREQKAEIYSLDRRIDELESEAD